MRPPPSPGRQLLGAVLLVAVPIVAVEQGLARAGLPLVSHRWWPSVADDRWRAAPVGIWATLTFHLFVPQRPWREAAAAGATAAAVVLGVSHLAGRILAGARLP